MAAYRPQYITLGTLNCGTRAIDCFDWSSLFGSTKRGQDRIIPGKVGREPRPRVVDEHRAALHFRLRGDYSTSNQYIPSNEDAWHANMYSRLAMLRTVCDITYPQQLTLTYGASTINTFAIVEEMGSPNFQNPWIATLVVDVTLPNGPFGT